MSSTQYKLTHNHLAEYHEDFIDPVLRGGNIQDIVYEAAEQIYEFKLFTPEFCQLVIDEAEHYNNWRVYTDVLEHPYAEGCKNFCLPDQTLQLYNFPGMEAVYAKIVERHLEPLMQKLWPVFKIQKINPPYLLKYEPEVIRGMGVHYDLETVGLVIYLNEEFEGGGTSFPRWNYNTGKPKPGSAIIYPGGLSHVHEGLPITAGKRYL
ncbi:MAG: hypothetical protein JNN15_19625, partial [Blastocatellia bacterium]|nr:hypothetical protein [Blastocatellia bacterium]